MFLNQVQRIYPGFDFNFYRIAVITFDFKLTRKVLFVSIRFQEI